MSASWFCSEKHETKGSIRQMRYFCISSAQIAFLRSFWLILSRRLISNVLFLDFAHTILYFFVFFNVNYTLNNICVLSLLGLLCTVLEFIPKDRSLWLILWFVHTVGFDRGKNEDAVWVSKIRLIFNCIVYIGISTVTLTEWDASPFKTSQRNLQVETAEAIRSGGGAQAAVCLWWRAYAW